MNHRKETRGSRIWVPLSLVLLFTLVITACATTGDIPVELDRNDVVYISPANQDGIQDDVTVSTSAIPLERTVLKSYLIEVYAESGERVRTIEESVPKGRWWMRKERRRAVEPPDLIVWDGRNDAGSWVPDGPYGLTMTVRDNRNNLGTAPDLLVIVDNTPPSGELSAPFLRFTPNGDGRLDDVTIFQHDTTWEERWEGAIYPTQAGGQAGAEPADGDVQPLKTWTWEGMPEDIVWDGTSADGAVAPAGLYTYRLSATDRAGNSGEASLSGIELIPTAQPFLVDASSRYFSPDGDGVQDSVTITARPHQSSQPPRVERWELTIVDRFGLPLRTISPGDPSVRLTAGLPTLAYDGRDDRGTYIPDGSYRAVLTTYHPGEQVLTTASPLFTADTQPPFATATVPYRLFSPDGDGRRDTLPVTHAVDEELLWRADIVLEAAREPDPSTPERAAGRVVQSITWDGTPGDLSWDGLDGSGAPAPDGTYTYRLSGTDQAGNRVETSVTRIQLDRRPTPVGVAPGYRRFSPNDDGRFDTLPIRLNFGLPEGITAWRVTLVDSGGTEMGEIASGRRVPAMLEWDGIMEGRQVPDGQYSMNLTAEWLKGNISRDASEPFFIDTTPPVVTLTNSPNPFSPDGDGREDALQITLRARDTSPIEDWTVDIHDPAGSLFRTFSGSGTPPAPISWDGRSETGELVQSAATYRISARVRDSVWNSSDATDEARSDILVIQEEGERLRIVLSNIVFAPFTADYRYTLPAETARVNLDTLDRLAETLKRFPEYTIALEGHAVSVYWNQPERARREHLEVLVPLSMSRAEAIRDALVERGIQRSRMTTRGYGGSRPVVPHSDLENRWKSRRVEFILNRRE
jgi:outer membrane protein OmpA-like peptidoglycan-associated protein/flagellar hook assembly protein FlgD